jgi:hypothetical protein
MSLHFFFQIFYFLESLEIGLQLNIEKLFPFGTTRITLAVFIYLFIIIFCVKTGNFFYSHTYTGMKGNGMKSF